MSKFGASSNGTAGQSPPAAASPGGPGSVLSGIQAERAKRPAARGPDVKAVKVPFLGSTLLQMKEICTPPAVGVELSPPPRGWEFQDAFQRSLANLVGLLGWDIAAEFLVETEQTQGFRFEEMITVPAARDVGNPSVVSIVFVAPQNDSLMFKTIEIVPANCTADEFGTAFISETSEGEIERPERIEDLVGVAPAAGRIVLPQSVVREDRGGLTLFMLNADPFSVARYAVDVYGWTIER